MAFVPPNVPPEQLRAGDTIDFVLRLAEFSPLEWTLTASFRGPTAHDVDAVAYEGSFRITVDTAGWTVGTYAWIARLTNIADATQKHTVAQSTDFELEADLAQPGAAEPPSHAAKMVALLQAALEGTAPQSVLSYKLPDGREIARVSPLELHALLVRYEAILGRENAAKQVASGKRNGRTILVRF